MCAHVWHRLQAIQANYNPGVVCSHEHYTSRVSDSSDRTEAIYRGLFNHYSRQLTVYAKLQFVCFSCFLQTHRTQLVLLRLVVKGTIDAKSEVTAQSLIARNQYKNQSTFSPFCFSKCADTVRSLHYAR